MIIFSIAESDDDKPFTIDETSGELFSTKTMNSTAQAKYGFRINADNLNNGDVVQRTQTHVVVGYFMSEFPDAEINENIDMLF